ncbi:respiratory chain complex I subunit 1 family protein [Campylobacter sp. MG1]|uniref:respiratory chain complex I subunit 1 family protein n=1 Tax=Campylobacter sp. MG1 TaxID=2976332 RepID=UPI00226CF71D|nr:NADH-quinone oxidoreductase subunit H [Campylobacter sp. MG1]
MSDVVLILFQLLALLMIAPLIDGIARKIRAKYQARIGPPIWQTYRDLAKLFNRSRTMPTHANPLYKFVPHILLTISLAIFLTLPITYGLNSFMYGYSDIFIFLYLDAFFRLVFALGGYDSGSPFAGVGSSREMLLGIYVEPIVILSLCVIMFACGTSSFLEIKSNVLNGDYGYMVSSFAVASIAFLWAMYIESGRKPYDFAEAHEELQEGLLSEYSGRDLALVQLSLIIKQFCVIGFFLVLFEPWNFSNPVLAMIVFILEASALYILGIFIDNFSPRFKITSMVKQSVAFASSIAIFSAILFVVGV